MRIFKDFKEARGEIKRDLKEMGVSVDNTHMQDKQGNFPTIEIQNYGYTVLQPDVKHLGRAPSENWMMQEWQERYSGIYGKPTNPGRSWEQRKDIWSEFLEANGTFSYTYSERFAQNLQVQNIIKELKSNPISRQLYIGMWDSRVDSKRLGKRRVPCSLGWHLMFREGTLNITYSMRSCDFTTHWHHDVFLTMCLLDTIATAANFRSGKFSQFINSFHVYQKDVADIF